MWVTMTRPLLVPFKAEHMLTFVSRDTDILQEMRFAVARECGGPAFTALVGDRVIGCGGIVVMWPGVGMAWVSVSKDIERHGVWLTRTVKGALRDIVRSLNLHRVEAVVLCNGDHRWLQAVGFKLENDMARAYTQDKRDVVRFEYIQEGV